MQKILLIIFMLFSCGIANAQNTFEKIVDTLGCTGVLCIQETFDGGYIFTGAASVGSGGAVLVAKMDSIGTIQWAKTYDGPGADGGTYIEQLPDSGYIVNGTYNAASLDDKCWLLRLDAKGDTLWTKILSAGIGKTSVDLGNSMANLNDSIYGMTGYFTPVPLTTPSPFFICTLNNGVTVANKIYNYSTFGSETYTIEKTKNSRFILAGTVGISNSTSDIYIICIQINGDTLWTKNYNKSTNEVTLDATLDNNFDIVLCGFVDDTTLLPPRFNSYLIKIDSNGDTIWTKQYRTPEETTAYAIHQTSDEGYITVGRIVNGTPLNGDLFLLKTDSLGNTLWTKQFGDLSEDMGYFIRQTKDGGYIISGTTTLTNPPKQCAYIIKTDSIGNVLTGLNGPEINNPISFNVYPNPSSGNFTFLVKTNPNLKLTLSICNVLNQQVHSCQLNSNTKEQINLELLPNGIYIANVIIGEYSASQKIIIQK